MKNDKFNQTYENIINESNKTFEKESGAQDLPQQYLINLPQIKQCILSNHFGRALADEDNLKLKYTISKDILYKNIQLFLEDIFHNKNLLKRINNSEVESYSMEFLCNTSEKFDGDKNKHLVIPFIIHAKKVDNKYEYYIKLKTLEIKNSKSYQAFAKNGCKSTKKEHKYQIPITILGEDIEKTE